MKQFLLLSVLGICFLSSCSSAFKAGQTPDDLYYSPGRPSVSAREEKKEQAANQDAQDKYDLYSNTLEDHYLRMKVSNPSLWSPLDDYSYWNDMRYDFGIYNYSPYMLGYNPYYFGSPFQIGFGYMCYYPYGYGTGNFGWRNPLYTVISYSTPSFSNGGGGTSNAGTNLAAYKSKAYNNSNAGYFDPKSGNYVTSGGQSNFGTLLKRVFNGPASNPTASSYDRAVRSYNTSSPANNNSSANSSSQRTYSSSTPSSSAGGSSGGFQSTGTTATTGRGGRGN